LSSHDYISHRQPGRLVRDAPCLAIGVELGLIMLCGNTFDWPIGLNAKGGVRDKNEGGQCIFRVLILLSVSSFSLDTTSSF
jgi:hypothetical protein